MKSCHECAKLVCKLYTFLSLNLGNTFVTQILVSNKGIAAVFKTDMPFLVCYFPIECKNISF